MRQMKQRNVVDEMSYFLGTPRAYANQSIDLNQLKTALVVFPSQKQATKFAYVRTRIAFKRSFCYAISSLFTV